LPDILANIVDSFPAIAYLLAVDFLDNQDPAATSFDTTFDDVHFGTPDDCNTVVLDFSSRAKYDDN